MMKTLLLVLLFAASALAEPGGNDGVFWQAMPREHRLTWALGWLEGTTAAEALFHGKMKNWNGTTSEELAKGLTQFYEADYRNLKVRVTVAAIIVMNYSRDGMSKAQMEAFVAKMREASISEAH